jgi:hypothetical protein
VTYPVNVTLSVYCYAAFLGRSGGSVERKPMLLIAGFALAFLHYEFARKTAWHSQARTGKRLYSASLGEVAALSLTLLFAAGAIAVAVVLFAPLTWFGWAPILAFVPVLAGARRFYAQRAATGPVKSSTPMASHAMIFLTVYYVTILVIALTPGVSW